MNILLVEDEPKVAAFIRKGLEENHHSVTLAYNGSEGIRLAGSQPFDLIILDVILPGESGIDVCKTIRSHNNHLPILMLTALGTTEDKIAGLDSGADDYLVKPFQFNELLARIRALSRRKDTRVTPDVEQNVLRLSDLELNLTAKTAIRNGMLIKLTAREFKLLEFFMQHAGRVVDRATIATHVWDISFDTGTNMIDVYVNYLRNKIDKPFKGKLIHTVVGMGYVMRAEQ